MEYPNQQSVAKLISLKGSRDGGRRSESGTTCRTLFSFRLPVLPICGATSKRFVSGWIVMIVLVFGACAVPGAAMPGGEFAGTAWSLHAIQSMDDAQGTTRIADPKRFTVHFGTDGRASLRLDCNRGTASWKMTPAADRVSGQLQFSSIAATRARCPPPHLDERVARDLAHVRGYLLRDGNLYMSLMADGGIYEWRPLQE